MILDSTIRRRTRFVATIVAVGVLSLLPGLAAAQGNGKLQIHYVSVGQGDAAVLISPLGETVMVDDGPGECSTLVSYLQSLGITHIDYHIASHYHEDHIGCAQQLLSALPLQQVALDRGGSYSSAAYSSYVTAVGAKRRTATVGTTVTLDATSLSPTVIEVVALNGAGTGATDENDLSLVAVVRFGNFHAVFGGDVSGVSEGVVYPPPPDSTPPPAGATARCMDRTWSYSQNRSGTCSYHGGVWYWVCPGLLCDSTPTPSRAVA